MKIEFILDCKDKDESKLVNSFCDMLVSEIQNDILNSVNYYIIDMYESSLIDSSWILWSKKPKSINMKKLVKYIVRNIICIKRRHGRYIICINRSKMLPSSSTSIDLVARFLDKGNEIYNGTFFISKVFMKYRKNIKKYWKSYVSIRLKKVSVSEVIVVK